MVTRLMCGKPIEIAIAHSRAAAFLAASNKRKETDGCEDTDQTESSLNHDDRQQEDAQISVQRHAVYAPAGIRTDAMIRTAAIAITEAGALKMTSREP